jgi:hypothetical protein
MSDALGAPLRFLGVAVLLSVPLLASPVHAGKKSKIEPSPPSGFLTDYGRLQGHPDDPLTRVYMKDHGRLADYDSFLVEPVELLLVEGGFAERVSADELSFLQETLAETFHEALSRSGYRSVANPGPGTLRISLALTDARPVGQGSRSGHVAATAAAGVALPGAGLWLPRFKVGLASIEMELADSESNELIGAAMSTRRGKRNLAGMKGLKRWGDARGAFHSWAKEFCGALDEAHGRGVHLNNSNLHR